MIRWILRSLAALAVLILLAVGALFLIPAERVAGLVVGKFKTLTGRDLVIEGSVRPSIWPVLGVKTGKVAMSNADWSSSGPMFQAEGLEIAVDMAGLLNGEVKVRGVEAVAPVLILERARDGRANWIFGGDNGGTVSLDTPGVGKAFTLDRAVIADGRVVYVDHAQGRRVELTALDLETAIADFNGPVDLTISAEKEGQPFALELTLGRFRDFLDGKLGPVEADFVAGEARAHFSGQAGWNPLAAKGDLESDLGTLAELSALAGTAPPRLPQGLGAGGVTVKGAVTLTDKGSLHLRGGTVVLDETVLAVDADLTPGEARPKVTAKVVAGALNLAAVAGGAGGGAQGGMQAEGWPKDRIDVSGLAALDADISLKADGIDLGLAKFGPSALKMTLDRSRAVFDIAAMKAYGGAISGQFVVNGRKGLSVGGDLGFAGMNLQSLMRDFAGYERLVGTGDLRLKFLGAGGSVDAIMQGLEGSGSLSLGKGEILGLDIGGMIRTLDSGYVGEGQKTIFDSLTAGFTIAGGVLQNDDLVMTTPFAEVTGKGKLGLGARTINYGLRAKADVAGQVLTVPILIKGPWADPKISLDLEALAKERMDLQQEELEAVARAKAKALEAETKAKAKTKLEKELGVVQQEGETLEEAVKRRGEEVITDEAAKALQKLLGGGN